ncbi:MAG: hypothetical protein P0S95_02525 [Rhabdochlamydiaceae bacterium]|nr:hypothetical protein [Candidatus Amphrikana amoebophyrae]
MVMRINGYTTVEDEALRAWAESKYGSIDSMFEGILFTKGVKWSDHPLATKTIKSVREHFRRRFCPNIAQKLTDLGKERVKVLHGLYGTQHSFIAKLLTKENDYECESLSAGSHYCEAGKIISRSQVRNQYNKGPQRLPSRNRAKRGALPSTKELVGAARKKKSRPSNLESKKEHAKKISTLFADRFRKVPSDKTNLLNSIKFANESDTKDYVLKFLRFLVPSKVDVLKDGLSIIVSDLKKEAIASHSPELETSAFQGGKEKSRQSKTLVVEQVTSRGARPRIDAEDICSPFEECDAFLARMKSESSEGPVGAASRGAMLSEDSEDRLIPDKEFAAFLASVESECGDELVGSSAGAASSGAMPSEDPKDLLTILNQALIV